MRTCEGHILAAYILLERREQALTNWEPSLFYIGNSAAYSGRAIALSRALFMRFSPVRGSLSLRARARTSHLLVCPERPIRCREQDGEPWPQHQFLQGYLCSTRLTLPAFVVCTFVVISTVASGGYLILHFLPRLCVRDSDSPYCMDSLP